MLGTLSVTFTFDGLDIFGNPENVVSARCWRNGAEIFGDTTMQTAMDGEFVSLDVDFPPGDVSGLELALVDDEGTTGLRAPFSVQVTDEGPTAPSIGSVVFVPKQVTTSS